MNVGVDMRLTVLTAALAIGVTCAVARGDGIVAIHDWNDGMLQNWTEDQAWASLAHSGTGGIGNSGYLQAQFTAGRGLGQEDTVVYVSATNFFAGTWREDMWVEFDFWAQDVVPSSIAVQWESDDSTRWEQNVFDSATDTLALQTWTTFGASFEYTYWSSTGNPSEQEYLDDLANINWIGVYIFDGTGNDNLYGLDDFKLMIPEPSEYALAAAAMLVMLMSVRRKYPQLLSCPACSSSKRASSTL